jgi:formate dehydrogenase beta subunit
VSFGHVDQDRQARDRARRRQHRDGLLPHRARLGGEDVKVIVRSGFEEMKASPWEKEDAVHEGIPILNYLVPKAFLHTRTAKLTGMSFEKVAPSLRRQGPAQPGAHRRTRRAVFECDDVLIAVGQENSFPWIERDSGIEFDRGACPSSTRSHPAVDAAAVFFGGDAALGPKNIIWAVAHGHDAAVSIDKFLNGEDVRERPPPG